MAPSEVDSSEIRFTNTEKHVLHRICDGTATEVIARQIRYSQAATQALLRSLYRKIGVKNRNEASLWGTKNGYGKR